MNVINFGYNQIVNVRSSLNKLYFKKLFKINFDGNFFTEIDLGRLYTRSNNFDFSDNIEINKSYIEDLSYYAKSKYIQREAIALNSQQDNNNERIPQKKLCNLIK